MISFVICNAVCGLKYAQIRDLSVMRKPEAGNCGTPLMVCPGIAESSDVRRRFDQINH